MDKPIMIGKYTLESLTSGMYKDPFIVYREYIQNSTDAIDVAVNQGLIDFEHSYINIIVNNTLHEILIEDNGCGIRQKDAFKILTDIGNSSKNMSDSRGFRGIGRLGGLSYCESIVFETSYFGENRKSIIRFDAIKLNELLTPGKYEHLDMASVIHEIVDYKIKDEEKDKHYFRVILQGVNERYKLLDIKKVKNYLIEVAPLPFNIKKFAYTEKINSKLNELKIMDTCYNIYLGNERSTLNKLFRPYKTKFYSDINKKRIDKITDVLFKEIRNDYENKLIALVWYGKCNLLGTVLDNTVKGFRLRKSGMLIGDRFLLNGLFKEERFNGWIQGEVLVFDEKIIPNARRDDFEKNESYTYLLDRLKNVADEISNEIRLESKKRNQKNVNKLDKTDNSERQTTNISEKDLIHKLDILIDKVTTDKSKSFENVFKVIRSELDEKQANLIIDKIEKLIS